MRCGWLDYIQEKTANVICIKAFAMNYVRSVLLIDDNPSCNFIMSEFIKLTDPEIEIMMAESVEEAFDLLSSRLTSFPEVIYVDVNMPVHNGFDFLDRLEQSFLGQLSSTRVFMLSSSLRDEDRHRALTYRSVVDFVSKNDIDTFLQSTLTRAVA
jgi:CheY-like chemotaxis protein